MISYLVGFRITMELSGYVCEGFFYVRLVEVGRLDLNESGIIL